MVKRTTLALLPRHVSETDRCPRHPRNASRRHYLLFVDPSRPPFLSRQVSANAFDIYSYLFKSISTEASKTCQSPPRPAEDQTSQTQRNDGHTPTGSDHQIDLSIPRPKWRGGSVTPLAYVNNCEKRLITAHPPPPQRRW